MKINYVLDADYGTLHSILVKAIQIRAASFGMWMDFTFHSG